MKKLRKSTSDIPSRRASHPSMDTLDHSQGKKKKGMMSRLRAQSMPQMGRMVKGIMHISTLEDSLHSTYGEHNSCCSGRSKGNIQFTNIEIREYARTVGDNPSCSAGPPITIAWEYNPNTKVLSVDDWEKCAPTKRTMSQMVLPRKVREDLLKKQWGVSQGEIAGAVRRTIRTKNQRRTTVQNLGRTEALEEKLEGATKKLLKGLFLRKSTSKSAEEMEKKSKEVERQRRQFLLEQTMTSEYSHGNPTDERTSAAIEKRAANATKQSEDVVKPKQPEEVKQPGEANPKQALHKPIVAVEQDPQDNLNPAREEANHKLTLTLSPRKPIIAVEEDTTDEEDNHPEEAIIRKQTQQAGEQPREDPKPRPQAQPLAIEV